MKITVFNTKLKVINAKCKNNYKSQPLTINNLLNN